VVKRCNTKKIRLIIEEDLWISDILLFPIFMLFNDFWLVKIPVMIVINSEISNPIFIMRFIVLLMVYFPLVIALKYFSFSFKCANIKNINPIPKTSCIKIGRLTNSSMIVTIIKMSTLILFII